MFVEICIMMFDDVCEIGVQVYFGEKYGDEVCVVFMGCVDIGKGLDGNMYFLEFCGGIYVKQIGDIGVLVIFGDSVFFVGVCWIEVLIGVVVVIYLQVEVVSFGDIFGLFKVQLMDVLDCV